MKVATSAFVKQNRRRLEDVYEVGAKLGQGSFGTVYAVVHKISREKRVCKKIGKGDADMTIEEILSEIRSMAMLDHPGVIKIYEYFDDDELVSQIMEPCNGGE